MFEFGVRAEVVDQFLDRRPACNADASPLLMRGKRIFGYLTKWEGHGSHASVWLLRGNFETNSTLLHMAKAFDDYDACNPEVPRPERIQRLRRERPEVPTAVARAPKRCQPLWPPLAPKTAPLGRMLGARSHRSLRAPPSRRRKARDRESTQRRPLHERALVRRNVFVGLRGRGRCVLDNRRSNELIPLLGSSILSGTRRLHQMVLSSCQKTKTAIV